jgi:hypothetical protein
VIQTCVSNGYASAPSIAMIRYGTERMIGVLTNSARAMLRDSSLPKFLWAKAFSAATYVHNRMPAKALDGRTPYKVLYSERPDVSHLRVFGAPVAIVKPKEKV